MKQDEDSPTYGVYVIFSLCTGLTYVGASTRLFRRLHEHFVLLRRGAHSNKQLQQHWNEFGPECFSVFPVESVEDSKLLPQREKAWIAKCRREGGVYNIACSVTERHRQAFKDHEVDTSLLSFEGCGRRYDFVSPTGQTFEVRGLRRLCEAYSLNESHMSKVARGILVQHKGWGLAETTAPFLNN